jgi:hypothetical protein
MRHGSMELEGFRILLRDCLRAEEQEELLVIADESADRFSGPLVEAAVEGRLRVLFATLPKAYQHALMAWKEPGKGDAGVPLPRTLRDAVQSARVILTLLDGDIATASVRGAVLNLPRQNGARLAHIPGLECHILRVLTESPIEQIVEQAELLAWALGEAREARLVTRRGGEAFQLRLDLGGWGDDPQLSTGVIQPGSWGNVPPGETFCCPTNTAAIHGEVVIDGSVPGAVLAPGEEAVLRFEGGRLEEVRASRTSPAKRFFDAEEARAAEREDTGWNLFAELGVGLNPAIRQLTGHSLFDEKAAGTIHIAIGDNSIFDGPNVSEIHADLVTRAPDLVLDGHTVIHRGKLDEDKLRSWRRRRIPPLDLTPSQRLLIDPSRFEGGPSGIVLRLAHNGRISFVEIAGAGRRRRLAELLDRLPTNRRLKRAAIERRLEGFEAAEIGRLLGLLVHYRIARIS